LIQKNQKIKAVNLLAAGFSATRHNLNGPSETIKVIKEPTGSKLCQRVSENTLFPPIDSRPGEVGLIFWLKDLNFNKVSQCGSQEPPVWCI
jgi:hypothetical protein